MILKIVKNKFGELAGSPIFEDTAEEIKNIRKQAGLTQSQLAELFGLSAQTRIAEYETGKRKPSKRIEILYRLLKDGKLNYSDFSK